MIDDPLIDAFVVSADQDQVRQLGVFLGNFLMKDPPAWRQQNDPRFPVLNR